MKYTIEKIDFDKAVKHSWSPETCLFSQSALRLGYRPTCHSAGAELLSALHWPKPLLDMRNLFDCHFGKPGDENKPELIAIRASLPIEIEIP